MLGNPKVPQPCMRHRTNSMPKFLLSFKNQEQIGNTINQCPVLQLFLAMEQDKRTHPIGEKVPVQLRLCCVPDFLFLFCYR